MSEGDFCIINDNRQFMDKYPTGIPLIELIPFYEDIAVNKPLVLDWVCPGRIDPKAEQEKLIVRSENDNVPNTETSDSLVVTAKMKEFDFSEPFNENQQDQDLNIFSSIQSGPAAQNSSLPLRRINNNARPPPRQPRVANMDKILNDFFKTRKETNIPLTSITTLPTLTTTSEVPTAPEIITSSSNVSTHSTFLGDAQSVSVSSGFVNVTIDQPTTDLLENVQQESLVTKLAKASVSPQDGQAISTDVVMQDTSQNFDFQSSLSASLPTGQENVGLNEANMANSIE